MISKEEAHKELFNKATPFDEDEFGFFLEINDAKKVINNIYDSIGSCGECKHYSLLDGACKLHSEDTGAIVTMMNHDFCSYFERK